MLAHLINFISYFRDSCIYYIDEYIILRNAFIKLIINILKKFNFIFKKQNGIKIIFVCLEFNLKSLYPKFERIL